MTPYDVSPWVAIAVIASPSGVSVSVSLSGSASACAIRDEGLRAPLGVRRRVHGADCGIQAVDADPERQGPTRLNGVFAERHDLNGSITDFLRNRFRVDPFSRISLYELFMGFCGLS
jgi:hypothetical protein